MSPEGQNYTPVDADSLMSYREATDGQILQEGICETGAMASFLAAGSAYAVHGVPTIPFYIFYSMFGFQRVGDMIWACADMMCRGFLLGGTAGRTTLNGEGIRRMYEQQEKIFYYLTVYNENHVMPAMPEGEDIAQGILRGAYCWRRSEVKGDAVHLLSSGSIMQQAIAAADTLEAMGYTAHIWSVTSFTELARDAEACERHNRLDPLAEPRQPYIQRLFAGESGPMVAVTDYMKALPNSISRWMPQSYTVLGTDGFGISESRPELRDHFEICHRHIVQAVLASLYRSGGLDKESLESQMLELGIDGDRQDPALR